LLIIIHSTKKWKGYYDWYIY